MKNNERLNRLPENIREQVKETLKGWCGCYVFQHEETKEYQVGTGIGLTKGHDPWECVESFGNDDVYTPEEIRKYADEYWRGVEWY